MRLKNKQVQKYIYVLTIFVYNINFQYQQDDYSEANIFWH